MAYRYKTKMQLRTELNKRLDGRSQADVAREIGIKPNLMSMIVHGAPINGKTLRWLGFRPVKGLYERIKEKP